MFIVLMKRAILTASFILLGGCATQQRIMTSLNFTMIALNQGQPFVSERFAERLALLVIDDRYPKDFFLVRGSGVVTDKGDVWLVTFENALVAQGDDSALPMVSGAVVPRRLTITIRKVNGEIVDIS